MVSIPHLHGHAHDSLVSRGFRVQTRAVEDLEHAAVLGQDVGVELPDACLFADFHQAVVSDVPMLLMSGERDPVTPPHYAAETAENYANSLNLVARGQAHSVMKNVCLREITTAFINSGSVDGLDTRCVDDIRPSPFFTSLLGPNP